MLLASGLLLGSWWAYTILGWGGFWFWDPVENAAFMPWLALTAFVHSIMVQKRRGMFRMWNIVLINVAFGLALYGMFMNRGGPVPSVHSFGSSSLGAIFLVFLAVGVLVPFAIFFWRYNSLKSAQNLDSMLSREAAFLVNNLLLLGVAFVTLWGTVYPLISELGTGERVTVARPFYDQVNGPLFLALVLLMGIGPLIPWRRANLASLRRSLLWPASGGLWLRSPYLLVLGIRQPYVLIGFGLCALVTTGIVLEWARGTRSQAPILRGELPAGFLASAHGQPSPLRRLCGPSGRGHGSRWACWELPSLAYSEMWYWRRASGLTSPVTNSNTSVPPPVPRPTAPSSSPRWRFIGTDGS